MKTIKTFKNNKLLAFTENNYQDPIKIYIDDNHEKVSIKKGYKINLIANNKGSYKGSFMNNYICKKFRSNQKVNLVNIETNKILNYCKYFLLSINEYINYFPKNVEYDYSWFLRSPVYFDPYCFLGVDTDGNNYYNYAYRSDSFVPFFLQERKLKNENN